jgi:hypothetical protein
VCGEDETRKEANMPTQPSNPIAALHLNSVRHQVKELKKRVRELEAAAKDEDWFKLWQASIGVHVLGEFVRKAGTELFEGVTKWNQQQREKKEIRT